MNHWKRANALLLMFCLMFCYAIGNAQQPQGQSRGARSADEYIKLLESERRLEGLQVTKVIEILKVKPGEIVADIGSDSGVFTRPLAQKVGAKGTVLRGQA